MARSAVPGVSAYMTASARLRFGYFGEFLWVSIVAYIPFRLLKTPNLRESVLRTASIAFIMYFATSINESPRHSEVS